jgi:hypothetical protein
MAGGLRVPRETCTPSVNASKKPILSEEEMSHVNKLLVWAQQNRDLMSFLKLFEAAIEAEHTYPIERGACITKKIQTPSTDPSGPLAMSTRGATPWKPIVDKGKKKVVDKGKSMMMEPLKLEKFQLHIDKALGIIREPKKHTTPQLWTIGPLKMEGKKKKLETTPPRVARVFKLLDEPEESKEPDEPEGHQLKRRKLVKTSDAEPTFVSPAKLTLVAPVEKRKGGFAALLAAQRKIGLKLMIHPMATYEALLFDEPIIVKPLAEVLLPPTSAIPFTAIPVDSMSPRLSSPNIQHVLEDIEMESKDSVIGGPNQTKAHALAQEKETRPQPLSPIVEARSRAPPPYAEAES